MFRDCYAYYDAEEASVVIGNQNIEKRIRLKGSLVRTEQVTDRRSSAEWSGETALWQRCPVLLENENPTVAFETSIREQQPEMSPHLKAVLELKGSTGTVWYEYIIFPEIPFVFSQIFAESKGNINSATIQREELDCSGIENLHSEACDTDVICGADTLDCIPLGCRHLEEESIFFNDKTDINDSLAEYQTVPVYKRGKLEKEGNIFRISDYLHGDSLLLIKHSPTPSSALNRQGKDLVMQGNSYAALMGNGIDFSSMPHGRVPYYASAVGVGKTEHIWDELWRYHTAFFNGDVKGSLFIMSNTWGDRSQDTAICESFILKEMERVRDIGGNIVQIDDGWENGITANSLRRSGGVWEGYYSDDKEFWKVNPERFPNGLEPIVEKAKEYGIEIGLWFSPDSSWDFINVEKDIETLWGFYQKYGIRFFKLDGVKIRSKLSEMRFIRMLSELTERSCGKIHFNLDVTAEDRFGYFYCMQYGTLFVENRYTDWGNYYPHNTFKNVWTLAKYMPVRRLQMEFLNNKRNQEKYEGMPFAPAQYTMDYLFASVMPSNPLMWMEVSHLAEEDAALLKKIIAVYKEHARELFVSQVIPVGECPNGMHFSGYHCRNADEGHLILFREQTQEDTYFFELQEDFAEKKLVVLYQNTEAQYWLDAKGLRVKLPMQRSFVWLKYGD